MKHPPKPYFSEKQKNKKLYFFQLKKKQRSGKIIRMKTSAKEIWSVHFVCRENFTCSWENLTLIEWVSNYRSIPSSFDEFIQKYGRSWEELTCFCKLTNVEKAWEIITIGRSTTMRNKTGLKFSASYSVVICTNSLVTQNIFEVFMEWLEIALQIVTAGNFYRMTFSSAEHVNDSLITNWIHVFQTTHFKISSLIL